MADKKPSLQDAADLAEKYGDTKTQDNVKKMQYPYATGFWGKGSGTDPSLYPSEARMQRYATNDAAARNADKYAKKKKAGDSDVKADPDSYKKGGKVKKTGMALVHKGERVLTKKQQSRVGVNLGGKSKKKGTRKFSSGKR